MILGKVKIINNKKGQSLVEFAIILPILIILLCAILDFGWIFSNQLLATYGCREGARYGAVNASSFNFQNDVSGKVMAAMPVFTHDGLVVNATLSNSTNPREGDVVVKVNYTFQILTPFASTLLGSQTYTTVAECTMKAE